MAGSPKAVVGNEKIRQGRKKPTLPGRAGFPARAQKKCSTDNGWRAGIVLAFLFIDKEWKVRKMRSLRCHFYELEMDWRK
jgi:hypothetical protein